MSLGPGRLSLPQAVVHSPQHIRVTHRAWNNRDFWILLREFLIQVVGNKSRQSAFSNTFLTHSNTLYCCSEESQFDGLKVSHGLFVSQNFVESG